MRCLRPDTSEHLRKHWVRVTTVTLLLAAGGGVVWFLSGTPAQRADRLYSRARAARAAGDLVRAEEFAATAWELDSGRGDAALLAAQCAVELDRLELAVQHCERAENGEPRIGLQAALLRARIEHTERHQFARAEQAYRAALKIDPDSVEANRGLARLLGTCARRDEAVLHVLRLVRSGVATDLLVMISRESGVINDQEALFRARQADRSDANPLIGMAWHAANAGHHEDALGYLREAVTLRPDLAAAHVALGRQLLAAGRFHELLPWAQSLPAAAADFAESWAIRAQLAEQAGDAAGALRCWWEAAVRAPESRHACSQLARMLSAAGDAELAERAAAHVRRLQQLDEMQNRVLFGDPEGLTVADWPALAKSYEQAGRRWEAYGWRLMAQQRNPGDPAVQRAVADAARDTAGAPLRLTADAANFALAVDRSAYPLPRWPELILPAGDSRATTIDRISFQNEAAAVALEFRYFNGTSGPPQRRMFELTGGGVAAIDYNRDECPDVVLTQGCPWPPGGVAGEFGDRLFRNRRGQGFADVTSAAALVEGDFGQGVGAADFDADGFPDLYVANIGPNRLWRNNGDGTFTDVSQAMGLPGESTWTTSCVLADLNGDALPDIYDVNYVTAADVFDRVCAHPDGAPALCMPFHFDSQVDRLLLNDGAGRFHDATQAVFPLPPEGKGLGAAVWDAHGRGRLSLFVANDTTPNFFFEAAGERASFRLEDRAIATGLALNADGKATGCMGVALADVDNDGGVDLLVTNFLAEPNTLYLHTAAGSYVDRTREMGLHEPSLNVLGFGTQLLDADLDGRLELFVANGHIDDLRFLGRPYRMPAQLFHWNGRRFVELDAADLGPYFQQQWLGRAAARLDWNRDGLEDLIVGHLDDDTALLTNTSTAAGRFLSLRLIGAHSARDAVGTRVAVRQGERTMSRQLTAGDGYQASNERRLVIGVGDAAQIDELIVRWPSGREHRLTGIAVSQPVILAESHDSLYSAP